MLRWCLLLALLPYCWGICPVQYSLRVLTSPCPPFSMTKPEDGTFTGMTMWLWNQVVQDLGCRYDPIEDVAWSGGKILDNLRNSSADVLLSCTTATVDRSNSGIGFTQPYYQGRSGIMLRKRETEASHVWRSLAVRSLSVLTLTCVVLLVVSHLYYVVEMRRTSEDGYFGEVWNALWWTLVTATTVGYGDYVPTTRSGRFVAMIWMVVCLFVVSYFTANLSSAITVEELANKGDDISDIYDLSGKGMIGYELGTAAGEMLELAGLPKRAYKTSQDGFQAVANKKIYAFVQDAPYAHWYAKNNPDEPVLVVEDTAFPPYSLAIALPKDHPLLPHVSNAILSLQETGKLHQVQANWLVKSDEEDSGEVEVQEDRISLTIIFCWVGLFIWGFIVLTIRVCFSRRNAQGTLKPSLHGSLFQKLQQARERKKRKKIYDAEQAKKKEEEAANKEGDQPASPGFAGLVRKYQKDLRFEAQNTTNGNNAQGGRRGSAVPALNIGGKKGSIGGNNAISGLLHAAHHGHHAGSGNKLHTGNAHAGPHIRVPEKALTMLETRVDEMQDQLEAILYGLEYLLAAEPEIEDAPEVLAPLRSARRINPNASVSMDAAPDPLDMVRARSRKKKHHKHKRNKGKNSNTPLLEDATEAESISSGSSSGTSGSSSTSSDSDDTRERRVKIAEPTSIAEPGSSSSPEGGNQIREEPIVSEEV